MPEEMVASAADGRLRVMRALEALFLEVLEDEEAGVRGPAELAEDEQFASEFALEVLELLGLEVEVVHPDGSMACRVRLAED